MGLAGGERAESDGAWDEAVSCCNDPRKLPRRIGDRSSGVPFFAYGTEADEVGEIRKSFGDEVEEIKG